MTIGTIRICYIDGTIQEIERAYNYKLTSEIEYAKNYNISSEVGTYKVEVNGHYIFVKASPVRYIGRAFDIDNRG